MIYSSIEKPRYRFCLIANPLLTNPLPAMICAIINGKVFKVRSPAGNTHYNWEIRL
jgi:hypothetical protein